jgi:hypothetical protein
MRSLKENQYLQSNLDQNSIATDFWVRAEQVFTRPLLGSKPIQTHSTSDKLPENTFGLETNSPKAHLPKVCRKAFFAFSVHFSAGWEVTTYQS